MDFLSATIISGVVYDIFKHGATISLTSIKEHLKGWLISDINAEKLTAELSKLNLNDEMSEKAIEKKIQESTTALSLIEQINKTQKTQKPIINQTHTGTGDNIGRDKITNN